jgi:6-phosphogluconolactonase
LSTPDWQVLPDVEAVAAETARRIAAAARAAIARHGEFRVVLAGGRTPEAAYRRLAGLGSDWERWQVYFGDERCLPADHAERNSRMAGRALLAEVPLPLDQVHAIPAELEAATAARRYASLARAAAPFDLVLLGVGEDGHTASLFPGRPIDPAAWAVAVHDAPKPPPERVSLGLRALQSTRAMLVVATGAAKREVLARWRAGEDLPIARVCAGRSVTVLTDAAANPA